MSKSVKNSTKNKRHSAPSAAAGSASQMMGTQMMGSQQAMGSWGQPMYYAPWQMQAMPQHSMQAMPQHQHGMQSGPVFTSQPAAKPWESESESEDSDFETKPKKCKTFKANNNKLDADKGKKRGPGRPTKEEVEYVASVPKALNELHDAVSITKDKNTCRQCLVYVGAVAIKPCGHALYCRKCMNKMRLECLKLKRPAKCYGDNCFATVDGWVVLKNVSA